MPGLRDPIARDPRILSRLHSACRSDRGEQGRVARRESCDKSAGRQNTGSNITSWPRAKMACRSNWAEAPWALPTRVLMSICIAR